MATLTIKVADKSKAVSVMGLRRFPVTFYAEEWLRILANKDGILKFIDSHLPELAKKADKAPTGGSETLSA